MFKRIIIAVLVFGFSLECFAAPPDEGKTIFMSRCASCHNVNKIIVGPALAGVENRHSIDWIVKFVQSSQTVIKNGDKEANALFTKFNHIPMPDHPDLTSDHIKSIVEYIKTESSSGTANAKAPFAKPSKLRPAFVPLSFADYNFFLFLLVGIAMMIFSLLVLVKVKEMERKKI